MKLPKHTSTKAAVLLALLCIVGVVVFVQSRTTSNDAGNKESGSSVLSSSDGARLYTTPESVSSAEGQEFTIAVMVDSNDISINGVDISLSYDQSEIEFVRIDSEDSTFDVGASESGGDGTVSIARGYTGATSGDLLIANVVFKSLKSSSESSITVLEKSVVVDAQQFTNVLKETSSTQVTLN